MTALRAGRWTRPEDIWEAPRQVPGDREAQRQALRHLPSRRRSLVPALVAAVRAHLAGAAPRPAWWLATALEGLRGGGAGEVLELALGFVADPDDDLRAAAVGTYYLADHPPAHEALLAAVEDPVLAVVGNAESGLVRQRSLDAARRWEALARLNARAERELEGADSYVAERLGRDLLEALASVSAALDPAQAALAERVLARGTGDLPAAAALLGAAGEATPIPWLSNRAPTFAEAHARWTTPGFALARYRAGPHADARWDDLVEAGHALYDAQRSAEAVEPLRGALEAGCDDPLVHYRLGVCMLPDDPAAAAARFRAAAEGVPVAYPDSPYEACAWEASATAFEKLGRHGEALEALRRGVTLPLRPGGLGRRLEQLELRCRLAAIDTDSVRSARIGALTPAPSRWHVASVTALALRAPAAGTLRLLSADAAGHVQLSRLPAGGSREVQPLARSRAHAPGHTVACWETDETVLSAGVDGRVLTGRLAEDGIEWEPLYEGGPPWRALAQLDAGRVALADAAGGLWLLQRERGALEPLRAPDGGASFERLLASPDGLVAAGSTRPAERWGEGALRWRAEPWSWVAWGAESERLRAITTAGLACEVDAATGQVTRLLAPPRPDAPAWCFRVGGSDVWAWRAGGVQYAGASPLIGVTEPLEAVDVEPDGGVAAYADHAHRLSALRPR
jgi:tetratricopeptide (TPR) repeat protein